MNVFILHVMCSLHLNVINSNEYHKISSKISVPNNISFNPFIVYNSAIIIPLCTLSIDIKDKSGTRVSKHGKCKL